MTDKSSFHNISAVKREGGTVLWVAAFFRGKGYTSKFHKMCFSIPINTWTIQKQKKAAILYILKVLVGDNFFLPYPSTHLPHSDTITFPFWMFEFFFQTQKRQKLITGFPLRIMLSFLFFLFFLKWDIFLFPFLIL